MEVKVYHFDTVLKMVTALLTIIPMEPWTNIKAICNSPLFPKVYAMDMGFVEREQCRPPPLPHSARAMSTEIRAAEKEEIEKR
ncbi:hypothetical protein AVEN_1481-1 [Araneus ventricosus]|uniref:Uncharacterized protein n=1 Tax=Araneus ventricosus TaxID=182803 RepID=A0A4Y2TJ67_ARAVE|nr:hypothetical protein AVEN_58212-1 [Araneus ventricosus]GBO00743.1 hypothetical protein AVEN_1481-1 [Araneus ventricosus]